MLIFYFFEDYLKIVHFLFPLPSFTLSGLFQVTFIGKAIYFLEQPTMYEYLAKD